MSEDRDSNGKIFILCSVTHVCVYFDVCFGLLSWWKIQTRPIIRFLTEAVRFWFFICWYLIESMMPCIWTRCLGPLAEKQARNIKDLNLLEFVFGWARRILLETLLNNMWWCRGCVIFFFRLSDSKTQLISAILPLWSLESLWPLKLSSSACIRTI